MKAMLFAAGLGTRLKPLTNNKPKALVEIGGITLLERCIKQLKKNGIRELVVNVHHFADQIKVFLEQHNNFGLAVSVSDESEQLLDTGGGILKAKELLAGDEPILLINVDVLTNLNFTELLAYHLQNKALATLVVRQRPTSRYLLFNKQTLVGWKNKQSGELKVSRPGAIAEADEFAFSGIHIIQPELLDKITETGKFPIIDLYLRLAKSFKICAFIDRQSVWMDLGKVNELAQAEELVKKLEA
jgi:NDP-sugar pyrophosphorylase family protein